MTGHTYADLHHLALDSSSVFHRLEGSPVAETVEEALAAEIRDPLWMLARQWTLGELTGNDAASPVSVETNVDHLPVFSRDGSEVAATLLEADLEADPYTPDLRARVQAGLDLRSAVDDPGTYTLLIEAFPLSLDDLADFNAADPTEFRHTPSRREFVVDQSTAAYHRSVVGRVADGYHAALATDGALEDVGLQPAALRPHLDAVLDALRAVHGPLNSDSGEGNWDPETLSYVADFDVPGRDNAVQIRQHRGGRLDWWAFDISRPLPFDTALKLDTPTFTPTPIEFPGMPRNRYWEIEDYQVDFGRISAEKTDIARLIVTEFALIYREDWFSVPLEVPRGSLVRIRDLVVTDSFGQRYRIAGAGSNHSRRWDQWRGPEPDDAGTLSGGHGTELLLVAPPSVSAQSGVPIEEVRLHRDEGANVVWIVEDKVASGLGQPIWAGAEWDKLYQPLDDRTGDAPEGSIEFTLMSSVAPNWFPLTPAPEVQGRDVLSTTLELTPFVRTVDGEDPRLVLPLGNVAMSPDKSLLRINHEEVGQVSQAITRRYARARQPNGKVRLWIERVRSASSPMASSGLQYDQISTPTQPGV